MRPSDKDRAQDLEQRLAEINLTGLTSSETRVALVGQLIDSIRRVKFVTTLRDRNFISQASATPFSGSFHPLRAAVYQYRQGEIDDAFWLIFLSVHLGKHLRGRWAWTEEIYGHLNDGSLWNWQAASGDVAGFRAWLQENEANLAAGPGRPRGFGNHRKRESLSGTSPMGTGSVVQSYVGWVQQYGSHHALVQYATRTSHGDPKQPFDFLFDAMDSVFRFGRLAKFDYLTMVGKLGMAPIEPGKAYLKGASGPLDGARLLFGGSKSAQLTPEELEIKMANLAADLGLSEAFAMQILEDAVCNWQKSPHAFKAFRG